MLRTRFKTALKVLLVTAALVLGCLALAIIYREELARRFAVHRIQSQTGLETRLDKLQIGVSEPFLRIENFALTNHADFGATVLLKIPELHVEYDPQSFAKNELRLARVKISLDELNIVKDARGRTNITELYRRVEKEMEAAKSPDENKTNMLGFEFKGIDELVLSVGTIRFLDLGNPRRNQEFYVGVTNHVARNVRTEEEFHAALVTLALKVGARNFLFNAGGTNRTLLERILR